jgi:hypothetical protein
LSIMLVPNPIPHKVAILIRPPTILDKRKIR